MADNQRGCPDCGSLRLEATANKTTCLECGHRFESGLQSLASRFV